MNALICPRCETPLDEDRPRGLCPVCLLTEGAESEAELPRGPMIAPSLSELEELFPELEILEKIGQGGMGVVYRAYQRDLDRMVALKVLPLESGLEPEAAERFTREARALAKLSHPGIVALYQHGQRGALYFFMMEFAEGKTLKRRIQERSLEPAAVLKIIPQICQALEYAHAAGVVHRDIKPANIILGEDGQIKVADFGLAKLRDPTFLVSLTGSGHVLGTPHYMAPEQVERPADVDHRADIYALGVVFYELLTGELPLGRFARPSEKVSVDACVDEVVFKALEKDPARRYQRAEALSSELEDSLSGAPRSYKKGQAIGGDLEPRSRAERRVSPAKARRCRYGVIGVTWALAGLVMWMGTSFLRFAAVSSQMSRELRSARLEALVQRERELADRPDTSQEELDAIRQEIFEADGPQSPNPPLGSPITILAMVLGGLALTAPFGATILGVKSLNRIRRSAGAYFGLPWAVIATLFYPLLFLDGLLMGVFLAVKRNTDLWNFALLGWVLFVLALDIVIVWALVRLGSKPVSQAA